MSIQELIKKYLNKEMSSTEAIRTLTGIINPDHAVDVLAIINQICRHEMGDLSTDLMKSMYEIT